MTRAARVAGLLGEALLYIAFGLALMWPVAAHLSTRAIGSGDARLWLWQGWRLAQLVKGGHLPTRIPDVIWPYGSNLMVADGALPSFVTMVWALVTTPTVAFNLSGLTALVANALAARHLASVFSPRRAIKVVCGLALEGAPALAMRLDGHYNLLFAFPAALILAVVVRVVRGERSVPPVVLGLLLALAYVSSGYYLFFCTAMVCAAVATAKLPWRQRGREAVRLAAAGAIALVVLSPFLVPKIRLERREAAAGARKLSSGAEDFSADVWSTFLPPPGTLVSTHGIERVHFEFGANQLEQTTYPGLLPLIGLAATIVIASAVRRPLLAAAATLWILGLGPTVRIIGHVPLTKVKWLPMGFLLDLPGMAGVRDPNRSSFVLAAVAVACLAFALAWAMERLHLWGRAALVLVCLAILVAGIRAPIGWSREESGAVVRNALVHVHSIARPGDSVIHLPDDCLGNAFEITMQMWHRLPEVGCQGFDAAIPWMTGIPRYFASEGWAALRCNPGAIAARATPFGAAVPSPPEVDRLRADLGVRFVVFNRKNPCPERGDQVLAALEAKGAVLGDDGQFVVVDLNP